MPIPEDIQKTNTLKKRKHWIYIALTIIWMASIFANSAMTGRVSSGLSEAIIKSLVNFSAWFNDSSIIIRLREFIQSDFFHILIRKTAHFIEFGILGLLVFGSTGIFKKIKESYIVRMAAASGFSLIYATTDEIHQLFVPGRVCSVVDVIIDFSGAVVFSGIVAFIMWNKKRGIRVER